MSAPSLALRAAAELELRRRRRERIAKHKPQPGPQTAFCTTRADICIYGGAAGGGKTRGLLLDAAKHHDVPGYSAVIFRRESPQIRNPGGLWDASTAVYIDFGAQPSSSVLEWRFPSSAVVKFAHLQYESDRFAWQGTELAYLAFDELTHFTEAQVFYLLSRCRTTCGVRPRVRATCNPDADSWVAGFIAWWIGEDGFPIPERAGVLRYMARNDDKIVWGDTREEVREQVPELFAEALAAGASLDDLIKSVTFIPSKLDDNPALTSKDPTYRGSILAQGMVERARLLHGNWKVRVVAGTMFKRAWFPIVDRSDIHPRARFLRFWDRAATPANGANDPDFTAGALLAVHGDDVWVVDMRHARLSSAGNEKLVHEAAVGDTVRVPQRMEQEPGSSGVDVIDHYKRNVLKGFDFAGIRSTGSKIERATALSAAAEPRDDAQFGRVKLVSGAWNLAFLDEAEAFPPPNGKGHDDQVDAAAGAFNALQVDDVSAAIARMKALASA